MKAFWGFFFAFVLTAAVCTGIFLRLYLLKEQIFADDEWHGFYYALGKSPGWLLVHFSIPGATCIPLNFYTWLLGTTVGWSETLLRLPSLICGVLCVIVCPLLAKKIIGPRRAGWLALLLAICPLLIFYSRIFRPYSAVAFFGFVAILSAAHWIKFSDRRSMWLFVATGIFAVYFHLFAIVPVAAPFLMASIYFLRARFSKMSSSFPPLRHWLIGAGIMIAILTILLLPAFVGSLRDTFFTIAMKGTLQFQALPRMALLICGTNQPVLAILFCLAFFVGALEQCRREPWFGGMLLSLFPLYALALVVSRPDAAQSAIVLTRYCIVLVPVSLLFVACGIEAALEMLASRVMLKTSAQVLIAFVVVAAFAFAGPLPQTYVMPNNFTSHGAYQQRYGAIDWSQSFYSDVTPKNFPLNTRIAESEVSPFYGKIFQEQNGLPIVEYPMMIGDHFNPLYYYQHFHRRPVIVGYTTDMTLATGLAMGNIYGNTYIDQVLSLVAKPSQLHFRNFISMDDLPAMRARHVEFVILHKRFEAQLSEVRPAPPQVARLYREYREKIGVPVYEDANVAAFQLQPVYFSGGFDFSNPMFKSSKSF